MRKPGFIIAGTNSGCGKTTVTAGILASLVKRGLKVQPFKVGPDFIDPMFHSFITGRHSRNLDCWMLDEGTVAEIYARNIEHADIGVVEGVMGLYDGYGTEDDSGSTAHAARITGLPVILVADPEGMALSAAALVRGFADFGKGISINGVIFNGINSEGHYRLMKDIVERNTTVKVLGYLRRMDGYKLGSRHLGLITASEVEGLRDKMDLLRAQVDETIDMEGLMRIASEGNDEADEGVGGVWGEGVQAEGVQAEGVQAEGVQAEGVQTKSIQATGVQPDGRIGDAACTGGVAAINGGADKVRLGVAYDRAFCFYYRDNLELLEGFGAELVYFSPLGDGSLPEGIDGLYIGGGYPEEWAYELECNSSIREEIRKAVWEGLPVYAECGGLMYLCQTLTDTKGRTYGMAGALPGRSEMTQGLDRFGYVDIDIVRDNVLSHKSQKIRGHEFHFSRVFMDPAEETCYSVRQKRADGTEAIWACGYKDGNLLAGYAHLHFLSNPDFAKQFVDSCRRRKAGI